MSTAPPPTSYVEDPLYRHARREAIFILSVWACCFVYTVSYCYLFGYSSHEADPTSTGPSAADLVGPLESFNRQADSLSYPFDLGIPDWVFYGIAVPWGIALLLTFFYGLVLFQEDDLGADGGHDDPHLQEGSTLPADEGSA